MSTTQDYDEPWDFDGENWITDVDNKEVLNLDSIHSKNAKRLVACVNACAGMTDPAAEIEAMREVVAAAENCRHWHDCSYNPATGKTEGVIISAVSFWELHAALDKLQPFIKP